MTPESYNLATTKDDIFHIGIEFGTILEGLNIFLDSRLPKISLFSFSKTDMEF